LRNTCFAFSWDIKSAGWILVAASNTSFVVCSKLGHLLVCAFVSMCFVCRMLVVFRLCVSSLHCLVHRIGKVFGEGVPGGALALLAVVLAAATLRV
jgi:hypothetical protein